MQRIPYVARFGDLHNHCGISYGHGSLDDAMQNAALRLDFASITGHAAWPDMPRDNPDVAHIVDFHEKGFARLAEGWQAYQRRIAEFEAEHALVLFPGYEIHSSAHGDYTIVGYRHELPLVFGDTPMELRRRLHEEVPSVEGGGGNGGGGGLPGVLAFPHHIGYRVGARGGNWDSFVADLSPVVEITSMHGLAEQDRSDRPFLHSMGPLQYRGTMVAGLEAGHRFGVLGNTDHHSAHPGSYGHGLTGVWSADRSRRALWEALFARRTWANTGDAVTLWHAVDSTPMGGVIDTADTHDHRIFVDAGSAIDYVELVDGVGRRMVWWGPGAGLHHEAVTDANGDAATDVVTVHVELGWGERGKRFDWHGEIRVSGAELVDVLPRFRGQEVVSPLDASDNQVPIQNAGWERSADGVAFHCTTWGNMTNTTPSTQGLGLRLAPGTGDIGNATVTVDLSGRRAEYRVGDLLAGARSDNLGAIDSPAFRVSADPAETYRWRIDWTDDRRGHLSPARWYWVRVRLRNGHWAISSPVWVGAQ